MLINYNLDQDEKIDFSCDEFTVAFTNAFFVAGKSSTTAWMRNTVINTSKKRGCSV